MQILIVEDSPIDGKLASKMFETLACTVTLAENGMKAINCAIRHDFDLVLIDFAMPHIDGYHTAKLLGAQMKRPTPMLMLTSTPESLVKDDLMACGITEVISKPLDLTKAEALIKRYQPT